MWVYIETKEEKCRAQRIVPMAPVTLVIEKGQLKWYYTREM